MPVPDQLLTKLGVRTPKVVVYKNESHKLCQAFTVKAGDVINEGAPVMLNADGTISPYFGTGIYIGVATSFSTDAPYPHKELTVMVEGYVITYGLSGAALPAGYLTPSEAVAGTKYTKYAASTDPTNFISLANVSAADELIQVLIK